MTVSGWVLLGAGLVLASLPFMGERFFLGLPLLRAARKKPWLHVVEFLLAYGLFVVVGLALEKTLGQIASQGWAFYAATFLLFVVAAFPAFAHRYLWDR
ncbi:hypothetical protein GCM10009007_18330 [Formosimonas limnophila]|uniref:DUF2818 family protein n=1 Tax=Formosimonas limnophila TaxID=1384487 RepID=A0A8J3G0X6_9BURK|nr:DUF2818 family protein [Formosimonas limnophila]GHA77708.1 hypothetical protein GCM10009007_18330 [Formosimonas limnophila]